jgi:hypothetical protein
MAQVQDQSDVIALLADPASHGGEAVSRINTHGAHVFLAGDRVYKLKRAVWFPYMDFSTPALRRQACIAELTLNRRTAPELYLGIGAILTDPAGKLVLVRDDLPDEAIDWVVVMRRFDELATFDHLAADGRLTPSLIDRLAEAIADFHLGLASVTDPAATLPLEDIVEENLTELAAAPAIFPAAEVETLAKRSRTALRSTATLRDQRQQAGRKRRCHGDLHLRNICLIDGRPVLFDALEFDDRLATIDVIYDLAFLIMDLEFQGLPWAANRLLNRYLERTADYESLAALPLYLSARAAIRAKVGASLLQLAEDDVAASAATAEARRYFDLALAVLAVPAPVLLAVGGFSGTGKTTLARGLATAMGGRPGAVILRSDGIRKAIAGVAENETLPADFYSPKSHAAVYAALEDRVATALDAGAAVIADAVFGTAAERDSLRCVAEAAGADFVGLWLTADADILIDRVTARTGDASDADAAVVAQQLQLLSGPDDWLRLDAGGGRQETLAKAVAALGRLVRPVSAPGDPRQREAVDFGQ